MAAKALPSLFTSPSSGGSGSIVHENFLEISPNIFSSFEAARPPVTLYCLSRVWDIPMAMCRAREPMTQVEQAEMAKLSTQRMLYLSRRDYEDFARYLSRRLGLLLTEDRLDPADAAHAFFIGTAEALLEFFKRPVPRTLERLKDVVAVLCEYLWTDKTRAVGLIDCLGHKHSLVHHSVKVCFMGLALYCRRSGPGRGDDDMTGTALGLLLHDLGALRMPEYTLRSFTVLAPDEARRFREHPEAGLNALRRLRDVPAEAVECAGDHHERLDGSGWPRGLKGSEIGRAARLCSLAEAFCELTEDIMHRPGLPPEHAAAALLFKGNLFDGAMVWDLYNYVLEAGRRTRREEGGHWTGRLPMAGHVQGVEGIMEEVVVSGADPAMLGTKVEGGGHEVRLEPSNLESLLARPTESLLGDATPCLLDNALASGQALGPVPMGGPDRPTGRISPTDLRSGGVRMDAPGKPDPATGRVPPTESTRAGMVLEQDRVADSGASTAVPGTEVIGPNRGLEATSLSEVSGSTPVADSRPEGGGTRLVRDDISGQGAALASESLREAKVRFRITPGTPDQGRLVEIDGEPDSQDPGSSFRLWTRTRKGYTQGDDCESD